MPSDHYNNESPLALPKLNLQFLTAHDYLLRNFHLFRLEAAYEVRTRTRHARALGGAPPAACQQRPAPACCLLHCAALCLMPLQRLRLALTPCALLNTHANPHPPFQVREDIAEALQRLGPSRDEDGRPVFRGWARMALPTTAFRITEVARPRVGELRPASVTGELVIDTRGLRGDMAAEWDELKQHDVLFLMGGEAAGGGGG